MTGTPAWTSLPTWFLVAGGDQAIPPDAERHFAERMEPLPSFPRVRATHPHGFDTEMFFAALDERRHARGLSWPKVAAEMWELSADLNLRRGDHPISPATVAGMPKRGESSCQHALIMLRWLERPPEEFIAVPHPNTVGVPLPRADRAHRLRWDLRALHQALNEARNERGATWEQTARRLHCTPSQLTGLRTAKFATGMHLAMRICQALGRPAADFAYPAEW